MRAAAVNLRPGDRVVLYQSVGGWTCAVRDKIAPGCAYSDKLTRGYVVTSDPPEDDETIWVAHYEGA